MPYGSLACKEMAERYDSLLKEYKDTEIIDAHSHFGKDGFWPKEGDVKEYLKRVREQKIGATFAMPVPCPVLEKDGKRIILSYYKKEGKALNHYRVEEDKNTIIRIPNLIGVNPYQEANDAIYQMTKERKDHHFDYVPLIHPKYYSEEDIKKQIERGAKVFKLHGVACGITPEEIDPEFFHLLEKYHVKLILHTDYHKEDNLLSRNSAKRWLDVLQNYEIKVYLAHAVRLDKDSIHTVNKDYRYIVGLGPDQLLGIKGQNNVDPTDYLAYCFDQFDENKIVFDIDYPWNLRSLEDLRFDWDSSRRVMEKLPKDAQQKVLKKNIISFIM